MDSATIYTHKKILRSHHREKGKERLNQWQKKEKTTTTKTTRRFAEFVEKTSSAWTPRPKSCRQTRSTIAEASGACSQDLKRSNILQCLCNATVEGRNKEILKKRKEKRNSWKVERLGPILFVIYTSDLPVAVKQNTCALFTDDTLVYSTCSTPSRHPCCNLQEDIDAVQTWSSDWNTTFNSSKSQQMVVGRHGCGTGGNLVLGGDKLQQVCTVSHLGLTLASTLKWSDHVLGILKRAARTAAALIKLGYRARVSVETMSLLYKTLLRPRLEYASIAWDNCSAADSRRLERLQLSVVRAGMHQRRHPSLSKSPLLKQLGWPTLAWRRRRAKLIYFWKLVNNQRPP